MDSDTKLESSVRLKLAFLGVGDLAQALLDHLHSAMFEYVRRHLDV
jgi:hypothetical protein